MKPKRKTSTCTRLFNARRKAAVTGWQAIVKKHRLVSPYTDIGTCFWPGWLPVIDETMGKLVAAGWDRKICEVKSKFCQLTIYLGGESSPKLKTIVKNASAKSSRACEYCGKPHKLKTPMCGRALCEKCEQESA